MGYAASSSSASSDRNFPRMGQSRAILALLSPSGKIHAHVDPRLAVARTQLNEEQFMANTVENNVLEFLSSRKTLGNGNGRQEWCAECELCAVRATHAMALRIHEHPFEAHKKHDRNDKSECHVHRR
jgi:hypothetical protein